MKSRIAAASLIWTVTLILSRVIGLVRDSVLGHTLGTSAAASAYRAAFTIPDWFNSLLAGGTLSIVFIPVFTGHLARGDDARAWRAFSNLVNLLLLLMGSVGLAMWLGADVLARLAVPDFTDEQTALVAHLTRIVLPAQVFHILGGLVTASLLAQDRHLAPALAPLIYTTGVILGGLLGGTAEGFAWGVVAGAFCGPFLVPLLVARRTGLRWHRIVDLRDPDLRATLVAWVPVMLGGSLILLDDTLLTFFGSGLGDSAIAILGYAKSLMRAPMGIFGSAMGFAAYPTLSRLAVGGDLAGLYRTTTMATRRVLVLAFFSQVGLTVAAPEIGTLVYGTSRIPVGDMLQLGWCLAVFALALGPWSAQVMLARAFYAQGKGWVPARTGLGIVVVCAPLYWLLADRVGPVGLAVASSTAVTISVVLLQAALRRQTGGEGGYADQLVRLVPVTLTSIAGALLVRELLPAPAFTRLDAAWRAVVLGAVGGALFVGLGVAFRVPDLPEAFGPILRRIPGLRRLPGPA